MLDWATLIFAAWLAATVSGAAGFGGALILLPMLTHVAGAKEAIPILTLAQLMGNLSRAGFGFHDIRWRPVVLFCAGAVPASALGAWLFVSLPSAVVMRFLGAFLLGMVAFRRSRWGKAPIAEGVLAPAGAGVGLLSALAGSAGPLGAALFLGLHLPPAAYVASEAVTATAMHVTKAVVYSRFTLLNPRDAALGVLLGSAMVLGSWMGRRIIEQLSRAWFSRLVELLLVVSGLFMALG